MLTKSTIFLLILQASPFPERQKKNLSHIQPVSGIFLIMGKAVEIVITASSTVLDKICAY